MYVRENAPLPQSRARNFIRRSSSVIILVVGLAVLGSGFVALAAASVQATADAGNI